MSKTLEDLNAVLFSQIDKLSNAVDSTKLNVEIDRAKSMVSVAGTVISNTRLIHEIFEAQGGGRADANRPDVLRVKKNNG